MTALKPTSLGEVVGMLKQARQTIHKGPPALRAVKLFGFDMEAEHVEALVHLCPGTKWTLSLPATMKQTSASIQSKVVDAKERVVTFWV